MTGECDDTWRPALLGSSIPILEDRIAGADRLSVCLDFDGTLAPIVDDPAAAAMPDRTRRALESLAGRRAVDVAVVSGRGLDDLRERVGLEGVALAGNHGLEIERGGERWTHPDVASGRDDLERVVGAVEDRLDDGTGCRLEDKGLTATVHYRGADVAAESVADVVGSVLADEPGFEASDGRKIVEIRPTVAWDKGEAVRRLVAERDVGVYVGDDVTDEDAFRAVDELPAGGVGVLVGDRESAATFRVHDADGVRAFLEWLLESDAVRSGSIDGGDPARSST